MGDAEERVTARLAALEAENADLRARLAAADTAEDELRQQKDLLEVIFDHLPLFIAVGRGDGRVEAVNREWERTVGWTTEELASETVESILAKLYPNPDVLERAKSFFYEAKAEWSDFPMRVRDGRRIDTCWMNVRVSDGRWIGIGQDITERKRAEMALRESEELFRAIYEHGQVGIAVGDLNGRLVLVNPAFRRLLGAEGDELLGKNFREFTFRQDLAKEAVLVEELLAGARSSYEIEKRFVRKDKQITWVRLSATALHDPRGKPKLGLAVAVDISRRKRSEEALRRTQAYLTEAESLSHIGSWAVDAATGELVFWSDEQYRLCGFDPAQGLPPMSVFLERWHPEDRRLVDHFRRAIVERRGLQTEFRLMLRDGAVKHILVIGRPMANENGEPIEFGGVSMDVTAQRQSERDLHDTFGQLRALATQLNQAREDEGRRIARELHDELGSSLTSLKWDVEALENVFAESENAWTEAARGRLRRMTALLDRTVRAARRISSELRPVILDDLGLVEAVEWQCGEFKDRTGIACHCTVIGEIPRFTREHETAVFRIVQEALTNVLRHANATETAITFEAGDTETTLRITDNGRGIRPEEANSLRSLGLLGMRERGRLLGGSVEIAALPSGGTEVKVRIPTGTAVG